MEKRRHLWFTAGLVTLLLVGLAVLAACAAKATPTPTPRPPTPTPTRVAATATPTPVPPTATPVPPTATPVPKSAAQVAYEKAMEEFKAVEEAANKEGLLINFNARPAVDDIEKAFALRYPKIKLEFMDLTNPAVTERVRAEGKTGTRTADLHGGGTSMCVTSGREGDGVDYTPPASLEPGVQWTRIAKYSNDFPGFTIADQTRSWMINTKLVPPEREPKRFPDLLDPWWKGKIVGSDPSTPNWMQQGTWPLRKMYGDDFVKKLYANITIMAAGFDRVVATGEYAMYIESSPDIYFALLKVNAPVKFINAEEGVNRVLTSCNQILKGAPHPNAAKVYANFLLTEEGQRAVAATGRTPLRGGIPVPVELFGPQLKALPGLPLGADWIINDLPAHRAWLTAMLKELGKK